MGRFGRLRVLGGARAGKTIELNEEGPVSIGSEKGARVPLDLGEGAPLCAVLHCGGSGASVEARGDGSAVLLNGRPVGRLKWPLKGGDRLQVGPIGIAYEQAEPVVATASWLLAAVLAAPPKAGSVPPLRISGKTMAISRYAGLLLLGGFGLLLLILGVHELLGGRRAARRVAWTILVSGVTLTVLGVWFAWRTALWVQIGRELEFAGIRGVRRFPWSAVRRIDVRKESALKSYTVLAFRIDGYGSCVVGADHATILRVARQLGALGLGRLMARPGSVPPDF